MYVCMYGGSDRSGMRLFARCGVLLGFDFGLENELAESNHT